ncbi:ubiquitin carboxyl-terminal hydrolase [Silvanigrella aquatica]|uniref:USP domain-containing protein n=1 Tax=Silvanigrella aquatica TaxID=1915309 RepID=A0A1L4D2B9_9BACT|nr:ubiquitin carboxyl-terminal hydrolase [Silvanigrella aquatica]APJ04342.1 hypothetical protein AXG55_10665 [Silvanigrella aquatica]
MIKKLSVILLFLLAFMIASCDNSGQSSLGSSGKSPAQNTPSNSNGLSAFKNQANFLSQALGTTNLGNTCFANSVHKLIWSYLRNGDKVSAIPQKTLLQKEFYGFMNSLDINFDAVLNNNFSQNSDPGFKNKLNLVFNEFSLEQRNATGSETISGMKIRSDQMDADEYFKLLADYIELNSIQNSFMVSSQILLKNGVKKPLNTESLNTGHFSSNIFYSLNLNDNDKSLDELMKSNLTEEVEDVLDENTKTKHNEIKRTYLTLSDINNYPKKLFITLKRFYFDGQFNNKIEDKIKIPNNLAIYFHLINNHEKTYREVNYYLQGVIIHNGTSAAGHYYVYINDGGKWYRHDDAHVSEIMTSEDQKQMWNDIEKNGYILLFDS